MTNLTNPIFSDENKAREHLESVRWPNGAFCPHCGEAEKVALLGGKSTRSGLYACKSCREHFSVTVGTVMERSHVPLNKWVLAFHLMASSKKGMSAHQLHRMLGVTYKTAWFMAHRIREAMKTEPEGPLGGENKVVEADETYVGGKEKNKHANKRKAGSQGGATKAPVLSLVERKGSVRSFHMPQVTAKTLRPVIEKHMHIATHIMSDDSKVYPGAVFGIKHSIVNHSAGEYVRAGFYHTNTVEGYFSILKRGITGVYHHVSEQHLERYLAEFDFRYNERSGLGVDDTMRANKAMKGAVNKRLTYNQSAAA